MRIEEHERAVDQAVRALNARDWETYGRLWAEFLITQAPGLGEPTKGRAVRVKWVQGILEAFPDGQIEQKQIFGDGDRLCVELTFAGTHKGPLMGPSGNAVPATNKRVRFPYCLVLKFDNGEVAELHEYFDQIEILTQLGIVP